MTPLGRKHRNPDRFVSLPQSLGHGLRRPEDSHPNLGPVAHDPAYVKTTFTKFDNVYVLKLDGHKANRRERASVLVYEHTSSMEL